MKVVWPRGRGAIAMVLSGVLAVVAATELTRAFPHGTLLVPVLGSAAAATAVAAVTFGARPLWRVGAQVAGFAVFATAFLTRSPAGVVRGAVHGWAQILTSGVPVAATPSQRVVAAILVWAAAALGAELAARAAGPVVAALPALVAAVGARMLAARAPGDRPLLMAGAFVVVAGLLVWVRSGIGPLVLGRRKWLAGIAALLAAAVVVVPAAAAGTAAGGARQAFDPRQYLQPPQSACTEADPLQSLGADGSTPLVRVAPVTASTAQVPLRFAVLDTYDGANWSPAGTFQVVGASVPAPADAVRPVQTARLDLTVERLRGCLLPTPAGAVRAQGGALAYNSTDGVLQAVNGLRSGQRWEVTAQVPEWSAVSAKLIGAAPDTGAGTRAERTLPAGVPPSIFSLARSLVAGATSPFAEVSKLQEFFAKDGGFTYDPSASGGETLAQLQQFLSSNGRAGTSGQFAAAFAVLARADGLPARVVVGAEVSDAGPTTVTAADVQAWPEVAFAGFGWVRFQPTPSAAGSAARPAPQPASPAAIAGRVAQSQPPIGHPVPARHGTPSTVLVPAHPAGGFPWWAALLCGVAAMVVAGEAAVVLLKRRRRVRRRSGAPAHRVLGAWQEAVDRLRQLGLPPTVSLTASEVVDAAVSVTSPRTASHLVPLCGALNQALYLPDGASPSTADAAWESVDALDADLAASRGWLRRCVAELDPRPLLRAAAS